MSHNENNLSALELSILEDEKALEEQINQNDDSESENLVDSAIENADPEKEKEQPDTEEQEEEEEFREAASIDDEVDEDIEHSGKNPNAAFAKMRKEKANLEKEKQELAERLARLEGMVEAGINNNSNSDTNALAKDHDPEPDKELDREEWLEWKLRKQEEKFTNYEQSLLQQSAKSQYQQAQNELKTLESQYAKNDKAYFEAKDFLIDKKKQELLLQFPTATDDQISQHLDDQMLKAAAQLYANNINPAEKFREMADLYGYSSTKSSKSAPNGKTNLDKLKTNKRKSASLNGSSSISPMDSPDADAVVNMALEKAMSLTEKDWNDLESKIRMG